MNRRAWELALAMCIALLPVLTRFAQAENRDSLLVESVADRVASRLILLPPAARWRALRQDVEAAQVRIEADTLGDDMLIVVNKFNSPTVALRLMHEGRVVARVGSIRDPDMPPEDDATNLLLQRVVLGRTHARNLSGPVLVALLWCESSGGGAPHSLWASPVTLSSERGRSEWVRLPVEQSGLGVAEPLVVLGKDDEILVRTSSAWVGTPTFNVLTCMACYLLTEQRTWRVSDEWTQQVSLDFVDDAGFALLRAFEARHRYGQWRLDDLDVGAAAGVWLDAHRAVAINRVTSIGANDMRIVLFGSERTSAAPAPATARDTLGLLVRRTGSGRGPRWVIQ